MTTRDTAPWLDSLDYIANAKDAPKHARDAARDALGLYALAVAIHMDATTTHVTCRNTFQDEQKRQLETLLGELRKGKQANLATSCAHVNKLQTQAANAQQVHDLATNLLGRACAAVRTAIAKDDDQMLQWIARRRHSEPTQCGTIDTLPDQVQFVYTNLDVDWVQPWDDELTMHHHRRLQLTYDPTWSAPFRASHAWLWEQIALGEIERTKTNKLRALRRVRALPDVPDAAPSKQLPQVVTPF
jgi:hypothetical protein